MAERYNVLVVTVVGARGLAVMDAQLFGDGSSDPRVRLCVSGEMRETAVKRTNLEPLWNETFRFVLMDGAVGDLEVVVEDWDLLSAPDFMGAVRVPLESLFDGDGRAAAFALRDAAGAEDRDRGTVDLELTLAYDVAFDYFSAGDAHPEKEPNLLHIAVTRGRGLVAMDRANPLARATTSDPRARVSVASRVFETDVVAKSLSPAWHAIFECHVEGDHHVVRVEVEDHDRFSAADFMGCVEFRLDSLADRERHVCWHALLGRGRVRDIDIDIGEIELVLRWVHDPGLDYFAGAEAAWDGLDANELCVAVVQARRLPAMDRAHLLGRATTSDPLAKCRVVHDGGPRGAFQATGHVPKSLEPWWAASFALPVSVAEAQTAMLEIIVEDHDSLSANDFMGTVRIPIRDLVDGARRRSWHALEDRQGTRPAEAAPAAAAGKKGKKSRGFVSRMVQSAAAAVGGTLSAAPVQHGEIEIVLVMVRNKSLDRFEPDNERLYPGRAPNEVRVAVLRARGLLGMDRRLFAKPTSDPFVTLNCNHRERATRVEAKTLAPAWNEGFTMAIDDGATLAIDGSAPAALLLDVIVKDWDLLSAPDFMGRCAVDLSALRADVRGVIRGWYALRDEHDSTAAPAAAAECESLGRGTVEVALQLVYNPSLDFCGDGGANTAASAAKQRNSLRVAVLAAHLLRGADGSLLKFAGQKACSSRATVECHGVVRRTAARQTRRPEWHECFALAVSEASAPRTFEVRIDDALGKALGTFAVDVAVLKDGRRRRGWVECGGGFVELAIRWAYDADLEHFEDIERFPNRPPNCVQVAIVQARGLKAGAACSVAVNCAGYAATTAAPQENGENGAPWWNERLFLPLESLDDGDVLEFEISHGAGRRKAVLGRAAVQNLGSLLRNRRRHRFWLPLAGAAKDAAVDVVVRYAYDEARDFGRTAARETRHVAPNEISVCVIFVRAVGGSAPPPGKASGALAAQQAGEVWRVSVDVPRPTALQAFTAPACAGPARCAYFGDCFDAGMRAVTLRQRIDVLLQRNTGAAHQTVAAGSLEITDWLGPDGANRRRGVVRLAKPQGSKALRRAAGAAAAQEYFEVEVSVQSYFNTARTPQLRLFEEGLASTPRDAAVQFGFHAGLERARSGAPPRTFAAAVLFEAPDSAARPRRLGDADAYAARERAALAVNRAAGRERRARPPQPCLVRGAVLRLFPSLVFRGGVGAISCDVLAATIARVDAAAATVRVDTYGGAAAEGRWSRRAVSAARGAERRTVLRPVPVRGGEWHERYVARREDNRVEAVHAIRLDRLAPAQRRARLGAIVDEVALLAGIARHPNLVLPTLLWARGRAVLVFFEYRERVGLPRYAGSGR
ncbi:C2 domain-containing protein, partial [Pelagophyceae sp. CCMP2097]